MIGMRRGALLLLCLAACTSSTPKATSVQFLVQSPFCGPHDYAMQFSIDSVLVGTDTLKDKETSAQFPTTSGVHRLGARLTTVFPGLKMDTVVIIPADTVFTQIFDIYCS